MGPQGRAGQAEQGRAREGRGGEGRAGQQGRAGQGRAGLWGLSLVPNGKEVSPRIPEAFNSFTVLTGRLAGGLGRSLERPCKWSAALRV